MEYLCADIGGTNARLALVEDLQIRQIKIFQSHRAQGIVPLLKRFSAETGRRLPPRACIAAAGIVEGKQVKGTNIPWNIDCEEILRELEIEQCLILNDFEAAAWGLLAVDKNQLVQYGGKDPDPKGTMAVLGAGTGLGQAILVHCPTGWKVLRTEGGHASFSPRDHVGISILSHLMEKYGHVSFERLLSGSGLWEIYSFFIKNSGEKLKDLSSVSPRERPSHVTRLARAGDEYALRAVDFFFETYGEEASNLALKCLPSGGVYLTGGVTLHLSDLFSQKIFRSRFENKGRMSSLLSKIPVFLVKEPLLGILGSAYRLIQEQG